MSFLANFLVVCSLLSTSQAFAENGFEPYSGSLTWDAASLLPQYSQWQSMYEDAKDIADDLSQSRGKYSLIYKTKGGSSHQTLVIRNSDKKVMGIWSAPNHATYIESEIFEFNVARLLNRSQWATPATRVTLTGAGRDQAEEALKTEVSARACNRAHILNYMEANPHYIIGVYKSFESGVKPVDLVELVDRVDQKRLNPNHALVKMLNRDNGKPTGQIMYMNQNKNLSYSDKGSIGQAVDTELAKELSFLALVDALSSQRDRFGPNGSNMQAMYNGGEKTFNISLVDNGGGADSPFTVSLRYFVGSSSRPGVSRFEPEVLKNVLALDDFLKGKTSTYLNYHSIEELKTAIGYESYPSTMGNVKTPGCGNFMFLFGPWKKRWDIRWASFTKAVDAVATHMRKYENDPNAFFD
jgi:hypothetical protein